MHTKIDYLNAVTAALQGPEPRYMGYSTQCRLEGEVRSHCCQPVDFPQYDVGRSDRRQFWL
jgi:hypothetical protein